MEFGRNVLTSWSFVSGNAYSTPITEANDGLPLEIGSVTTTDGDWLDRVDSAALCGTTSSSYYFAPASDGVSPGTLYVNLPSSGNPNNKGVEIGFWKLFGSSGTIEPLLGSERVTDPQLDNWTDVLTPTSYTVLSTGTDLQVQRDAVSTYNNSTYSAKVVALNLGAGSSNGISQGGIVLTVAGVYHVRVVYSTGRDLPATGQARLRVRTRVAPSALYLGSDGRHTYGTGDGLELQSTGGEIREALFAIRIPVGSAAGIQVAFLLLNNGAGAMTSGSINLYYMSLRAAYRYDFAEPRLTTAGLPSLEVSNNDIFMGAESVGIGSLKILNTDDQYMETLLEGFDVVGRVAQGWIGGGFGNGQELPLGSCQSGFRGTTQSFSVDDLSASLELQDTRSLLGTVLPVETIGRRYAGQPGVSDNDTGRPVPILIGAPKYNMKCPRVSLETTKRLPIWLVNDPTYSTGSDIMGQVAAWAYTDEDAANRRDTNRRVACEFTSDNATGLVTLFSNPGPFEVLGDSTSADVVREVKPNDTLDFVDNVTTRAGALTPGLYTCTTLAAHAQTVMNAFGGGTFTVAYSNTAHTFTFTKTGGAGIFSILLNSGVNKHRSAFPLFGFSSNTDQTGASTYTSSVVLYDETRADQFFIRIDATGYRDDAAGTYTGITGGGDTAIIYQGPDILRFLLVKILKRPMSEIDATSFNAFRGVGKMTHVIYLGGFGPSQRLTVQDIIDRIEVTTYTDIVMDGQGKWFWKSRPVSSSELTTLATKAPILTDRDFIEFRTFKSAEDTYAGVSMAYDEDPVTGEVKSREAANTLVQLRHNRAGTRVFDGLWFEAVDAQSQAWNMMLLAVLPRRHYEFTCKGRLLGKTVGDLIKIRRTRMLGPEAANMANDDVARILAISIDPQTHVVTCHAYTADLPRNSDDRIAGAVQRDGKFPALFWPLAPALANVHSRGVPGIR